MLRCAGDRLYISQSSMELWQVGVETSYPQIGGF